MSIQAVILDMGGTLLRTENHPLRHKWETRLGLAEGGLSRAVFESEASRRASIGLLPEEGVWQHIQSRFGLSDEEMRELVSDFWSGDVVDVPLLDFIRGLRPQFKTAILSNAYLTGRWAITTKFGLAGAVDLIVISAEEGIAKPDPRIYRLTAERLQVKPDQCVFVDDVQENVRGAESVGMQGVRFEHAGQAIRAIEKYIGSAP